MRAAAANENVPAAGGPPSLDKLSTTVVSRNRLPLAELLVHADNASVPSAPPPPPMPSSPMWGQYSTQSLLTPVPLGEPSPTWPCDPIDVLLMNTPDSVTFSRYRGRHMDALNEPHVPPPLAPPSWQAGVCAEPSQGAGCDIISEVTAHSCVPPTPPSLGGASPPLVSKLNYALDNSITDTDDAVAVDLNTRLESLDAVVKELSADVAARRENGEQRGLIHKIQVQLGK